MSISYNSSFVRKIFVDEFASIEPFHTLTSTRERRFQIRNVERTYTDRDKRDIGKRSLSIQHSFSSSLLESGTRIQYDLLLNLVLGFLNL
jgi:hypothetical protein